MTKETYNTYLITFELSAKNHKIYGTNLYRAKDSIEARFKALTENLPANVIIDIKNHNDLIDFLSRGFYNPEDGLFYSIHKWVNVKKEHVKLIDFYFGFE